MTATRRARWLVPMVVAAAVVLYAFRLGQPGWGPDGARFVHDEQYTAFTAGVLARGDYQEYAPGVRRFVYARRGVDTPPGARVEWSHPPAAPLAMALAVRALGDSAVAVRAVSLLAAVVTLLATAVLAGSRRAPVACALLALDTTFLVFARTAMPHMIMVAALASGAAFARRCWTGKRRGGFAALLGAGACFGLAVAVRWTALPIALAALAAPLLFARRRMRGRLAALPVVLVTMATVYLATFAPYLASGRTPSDLVDLHRAMLWFHTHLPGRFPGSSPWYAWLGPSRPIVFDGRTSSGRVAIVACGAWRPLEWSLVPAVCLGAWRLRRALSLGTARPTLAIAMGVLATTIAPWALLHRFGFSYYLLPAIPFVAVIAADALDGLRSRIVRQSCLLVMALGFAAAYPIVAAVPLPVGVYDVYRAALDLPVMPGAPSPPTSRPAPASGTPSRSAPDEPRDRDRRSSLR